MSKRSNCIHTTITTTVIVVGVLLSACSAIKHKTSPERAVASAEQMKIDERIEKILSFKRSQSQSLSSKEAADLKRAFDNNLHDIKGDDKSLRIEIIQSNDLGPDELYKIVAEIDENNLYRVKLLHSEDAFADAATTIEFYKFLDAIFLQKVASPFTMVEMIINARANDAVSLQALTKLRVHALDVREDTFTSFVFKVDEKIYLDHSAQASAEWQNLAMELERVVKQERVEKNKLGLQRKELLAALDSAPENKQFRHLVSIGDRNGVADLIKSYLPWEEMQFFEKKFWEKQLYFMRNPLPLKDRVIIYRGLQDDILQTPVVDGKKLAVDEAIKEQNIFVMSTMMTKNQGSWNRRLRSLTSMNDKYMGVSKHTSDSEFTKAARISTFLKNHSNTPKGSPFLSFTPSITTAINFGKSRVSAFVIDPRALIFNYASQHHHEHEYLLPLVTFPDEIYAIHDAKLSEAAESKDKWLQAQIMNKLMREKGDAEGLDTYLKITANTKSYFNHYSNTVNPSLQSALEKHAAELAKIPSPGPVKPTDPSCKNILRAFWK